MNTYTHSEKRDGPRRPVLLESKAVISDASVMDVAVRDLSEGGARLVVPVGAQLPPIFRIQIGQDSALAWVRTCWRSANQLGVQFLSDEKAEELQRDFCRPDPGDNQVSVPPERLTAGNQRTPHAQAATARFLALEHQLHFEVTPSEFGRTCCVIEISLRNWGEIGAIHPFVCLPAFGFNLVPAKGWEARELNALRKMIRFSSVNELMLPSNGRIKCCQISLPYEQHDGGRVGYAKGTEHSFAQLPDINLTCQLGAANFPAERVSLVIPASHIAGFILDETEHDSEQLFTIV